MKFRNDIQEIRAVAILLVFFYHLYSNYVPGGYIGVDIFFVISGYLISSILYNCNNNNVITYIYNFYGKRIKRLFPSSYICLVCYYYHHPTLLKRSIQETELYYDIFSALLCYSNIRFYKNTLSYFKNEKKSILINYWSLSLEEQFYFLLPLIIYIFNAFTFAILSLLSFFYCVLATYNNDSSSYYLLYSRAWELLLGLSTFKSNIVININPNIILYILILSSYIIDIYPFFKFPGFIAIIPTNLTSLLLLQKYNYLINSRALEIIGNMSYIIYLFHYPIIQNNKSLYIIILKTSLISYLIYFYVEIPVKHSKILVYYYIISIILTITFIQRIYKSINNNRKYYSKLIDTSYCKSKMTCSPLLTDNINDYSVVLIGDSHLYQYLSVILSILDNYKAGNILILQAWIINIEKNFLSISNLILDMKKLLLCIISVYVDYHFLYVEKNSFEKSFKYLIEKILIVSRGIIIFQDNPHRIRRNDTMCIKYLLPIIANDRIIYIDIFKEYCMGKKECIRNIYSKYIFRDFHHLNEEFVCKSRLIYDLVNDKVNLFLDYNNINISLCNTMDLKYQSNYNSHIIKKYIIKTITKKVKNDGFGFVELPNFS